LQPLQKSMVVPSFSISLMGLEQRGQSISRISWVRILSRGLCRNQEEAYLRTRRPRHRRDD